MNQIEDLQFVVIAYDWSDLEELRRIKPQQCNMRGECQIGLLLSKHVLIHGYSYLMRALIYDANFTCIFSPASAVGKPIQLDQATIKKTRPSCALVNVMVDLKCDFPKVVQMQIENQHTEEKKSSHYKTECRDTNKANHKPVNKEQQVLEESQDQEQKEFIQPAGISNSFHSPKDTQDQEQGDEKESSKDWVTKSFSHILQGKFTAATIPEQHMGHNQHHNEQTKEKSLHFHQGSSKNVSYSKERYNNMLFEVKSSKDTNISEF
ncbi:hypothetical protein H5410_002893 [Solanum commersonii]|uniref:Uncharacterized protein n=1 Tax=Solanum commersonii TaxID=4109 RepID=A0A9J6B3H1_SOLCO|nr:hypothetical protein H5410_002893 [Solanum commersonii]